MLRRLPLLLTLLLTTCARANDLDAIAASFFKPNEPGAAVLVVKDGKTLLRKGYGLADMELGVANSADNIYRIGSVTKQFTAVAVLQLVQQGKIALADDITKHIPDAPTGGKSITIEHLLTHTSGIPSYTAQQAFRRRMREDLTPSDMLQMVAGVPRDFEPGAGWHYNNSGYVLLGMLIEKVSGETYASYMRKRVFEPAGMKDTAYEDSEAIVPRRAHGYAQQGGRWVNAPYLSMKIPFAAGALVSTVDDLARWTTALRDGKVVDPKLLARAQTPYKLTSGASTDYGYGWSIGALEGHRVVEHGGGIHGFLSSLVTLPDDNVTVVVLGNANRLPAPQYIAYRLAAAAIGKSFPPKTIALKPETLARYAGAYRLDAKRTIGVRRDGDRLMFVHPELPPAEMLPLSETDFLLKDTTTRVTMKGESLTIDFIGPPEVATRLP